MLNSLFPGFVITFPSIHEWILQNWSFASPVIARTPKFRNGFWLPGTSKPGFVDCIHGAKYLTIHDIRDSRYMGTGMTLSSLLIYTFCLYWALLYLSWTQIFGAMCTWYLGAILDMVELFVSPIIFAELWTRRVTFQWKSAIGVRRRNLDSQGIFLLRYFSIH
jgi:hypothetical protein